MKYTDPDGMNPYLIYNDKTKTLSIYDDNKTAGKYKDDKLLGTFSAHNNVTSDSKGKWEDGKYEMLDKNTRATSTGQKDSKGILKDSKNGMYGEGGIYRAKNFNETTTSETRTGMAVHAGRDNKNLGSGSWTGGCVRTTPEAMTAIDGAIEDYGPLQSLIVQNNRKSDNSESVNSISPGSASSESSGKKPGFWDYVKTAASLIMSVP